MKLRNPASVQACIQNFISCNPEMKLLVGSMSEGELFQEASIVHESLEASRPVLPPPVLVSLVQRLRTQKLWARLLDELEDSLDQDWSSAEVEVCAIGLLWCSLLAQECGRNGDGFGGGGHGPS